MNERIKKLAEQCQLKSYGINGELLDVDFDEEKFAQLIVAECIQAIQNEGQTYEHLDAGEFQAILLSAAANVLKETK